MPQRRRLTADTLLSRTSLTPDTPRGAPAHVKPTVLLAEERKGKTGKKRDWAAEDKKYKDRGRIPVLIDPDLLEELKRRRGPGAGKGSPYPQMVVDLVNLIGTAASLPYRQRVGLAEELFTQLGFEGDLPDHVTLWRRGQDTTFTPYQVQQVRAGKVVLTIDASGLALRSTSGWRRYKHGGTFHQEWVKVHVGLDTQTGGWVSLEVTKSDGSGSGDVSNGPKLIQEAGAATGGVSAVLADRAYDARTCYQAARAAGGVLVTPPKSTAVYGLDPDRDQHLAQVGRIGERRWRERVGYGQRAHSEGGFSIHKQIFGEKLRAKTLKGAAAEIVSRVNLYNWWRQLETA